MIRHTLSDIFSRDSSFGEKCLVALMALLMLAIVGMLGLLAFILVDSVGITPSKTVITVVEAKQIVPAHIITGLAGQVPVLQYYPESYRLHFKIDEDEVSPTVEKNFFDDINVGDRIEATTERDGV